MGSPKNIGIQPKSPDCGNPEHPNTVFSRTVHSSSLKSDKMTYTLSAWNTTRLTVWFELET